MQRLTVPEPAKVPNNSDLSSNTLLTIKGKRSKIITPKYKNHNYSNIATASYDLATYKLSNVDQKK